MSKIRNSLGVLVLPIPDDEMTWEQYKAKYGIDLHSLFHVDVDGYSFKSSKLLAISGFRSGNFNESIFDVELVKSYTGYIIKEDDVTVGYYLRLTGVIDEEDNTPYCGIQLNHYTDGRDSPYTIVIFVN